MHFRLPAILLVAATAAPALAAAQPQGAPAGRGAPVAVVVPGPIGGDAAPSDAGGYNQRGYERMQEGRNEEALADFDKAVSLSRRWARPHANRGIALFHLGRFEESRRALETAAKLSEDDFVVWQGRALHNLLEGRENEALHTAERSLRLAPGNRFTLGLKGRAYLQLGRFAEAEELLADLLEAAPVPPAFVELAWLQAWQGRLGDALATLDRAAAADVDTLFLTNARGEILAWADRSDEAGGAFNRALVLIDALEAKAGDEEERVRAQRMRLQVLSNLGEARRAIEIDTALIARFPNQPTYLNGRCWRRATANVELEEALEDCNRALAMETENAAFLDSRGLVLLRLGRHDEAIADYTASIRARPAHPSPWYGRALARLAKGDTEGAAADLAAARRHHYRIDARYKSYGLEARLPAAD